MSQNPNDAPRSPSQGPRIEQAPGDEDPGAPDTGSVLVELAAAPGMSPVAALDVARRLAPEGFTLDEDFAPTPLGDVPERQTYVVRGHVTDEAVVEALEHDPRVAKVWRDTPVAPF